MCRTLGFCLWWMVPLNFLLSAFRAGHAPQAYFSDAGKVGKSATGRPRPPFVCPIGRLQGRYRVATEFPLGRWPLVIGAVLHELRLTALGMMGVSFLGGRGSLSVSHSCRQLVIEPQICLPLQKAVRRSRTSSLPQIRSPKDSLVQWQRSSKSYPDRLGKHRGSGVSPAVFPSTFGRPKVDPSETKQR